MTKDQITPATELSDDDLDAVQGGKDSGEAHLDYLHGKAPAKGGAKGLKSGPAKAGLVSMEEGETI